MITVELHVYIAELYFVSISYIQFICVFIACSSVSRNDASYSCTECAGAGGDHKNKQAWLATCNGKKYINTFVFHWVTRSLIYTHIWDLLIQIIYMCIYKCIFLLLDCPANCVECTSASTCTKCINGMYIDGGQCVCKLFLSIVLCMYVFTYIIKYLEILHVIWI